VESGGASIGRYALRVEGLFEMLTEKSAAVLAVAVAVGVALLCVFNMSANLIPDGLIQQTHTLHLGLPSSDLSVSTSYVC
jgi:hypothetical protein